MAMSPVVAGTVQVEKLWNEKVIKLGVEAYLGSSSNASLTSDETRAHPWMSGDKSSHFSLCLFIHICFSDGPVVTYSVSEG